MQKRRQIVEYNIKDAIKRMDKIIKEEHYRGDIESIVRYKKWLEAKIKYGNYN